jgi:hypothetical protein
MSLHIFEMVGPFIVLKSLNCLSMVGSTIIQAVAQASGQEIGVGVA